MNNSTPYRHDPYFKNYCGENPNKGQLKEAILVCGRVLQALVVWLEENVLLDGYTREALHAEIIGEGTELPPLEVVRLSFANRQEAEKYVLNHQDAMRQMDKNKRAWRYVLNHQDEIKVIRAQARKNQSEAGGALSARAPTQGQK